MNRTAPEFSRPLEAARVPAKGCTEKIAASPTECAALAHRMDVPALHACTATLQVSPWRGGGLKVTGEVRADLDQVSVISLETFRSQVRFDVERYFLPRVTDPESDADEMDSGAIDLGEIAAETLGLELDPYPRKSDETFSGFDSDRRPEAAISPFAKLASDPGKKT